MSLLRDSHYHLTAVLFANRQGYHTQRQDACINWTTEGQGSISGKRRRERQGHGKPSRSVILAVLRAKLLSACTEWLHGKACTGRSGIASYSSSISTSCRHASKDLTAEEACNSCRNMPLSSVPDPCKTPTTEFSSWHRCSVVRCYHSAPPPHAA